MDVTLTIRADEKLHAVLQERAELQGKTVSDMVSEILHEAVAERPLDERVGHLRGWLQLSAPSDPWRTQLKERSWRR